MKIRLLQVREPDTDESVMGSADVAKLMEEEGKADRECFWVLHCSNRNQIIEKELVAMGSLDQAIVHPREVFKKAILNGAKGIITVHNHPGGSAEPSGADEITWDRLTTAGQIIGIEVIDNIIITPGGEYYSDKKHKEGGD